MLATLEARARTHPGEGDVLLALGYARARAGLDADAARAFRAAALSSSDPSRAALAFFDLGVLALGRGELGEARTAFFEALARDPSDDEARFNLEWTLGQLARTAPDNAAAPRPDKRPTRPESGGSSAAAPQRSPNSANDGTPERETAISQGEQDDPPEKRASTAPGPESATDATSPHADDSPSHTPIRLSADEARQLLDAVTEPRNRSRMQKTGEGSDTTGRAAARGVVW
jgi:tetratricopeptide (TPR) repeat protein